MGLTFRTFWGDEVLLHDERIQHVAQHIEVIYQKDAIRNSLAMPVVVLYSHQEPGCQLYFGWEAHPRVPNHYVKVVVDHRVVPGIILTAMISDGPRASELRGGIRYDLRAQYGL